MPVSRFLVVIAPLAVSIITTFSPAAATANDEAVDAGTQRWSDFVHYVRIALPDLARQHGEQLLSDLGDDTPTLLKAVESSPYPDYESVLQHAVRVQAVAEVSARLSELLQQAQILLIRNTDRMAEDIRRLAEGGQTRRNAQERLRAAGQFAAPVMLEMLQSDKAEDASLHAHILTSVVAIGHPMVYPLSVALHHLEPLQAGQIAHAIADIGYARAAPYVLEVLETRDLDDSARGALERAYSRLAAKIHLPADITASDLFLLLGENMYRKSTREPGTSVMGFDHRTGFGIIWSFDPQVGLFSTQVPEQVFGDVLAMHAAQQALRLNQNMSRALSLWLAANLRRENRLEPDETDFSYPPEMRPPQFYVEMAGPLRQHDVLQVALNDRDVTLALDAIAALDATAGTEALVNIEGAIQPLMDALNYADRSVRFNAAFSLTHARPETAFPGSYRVVPILTEAVRQSGEREVLVISRNEADRNRLVATVNGIEDHHAIGGLSIEDESLMQLVRSGPGIDLIITDLDAVQCGALVAATATDYHLAGVPLLALVSAGDQTELARLFDEDPRVSWAHPEVSDDELATLVRAGVENAIGDPITREEADAFALRAVNLLHDVAISHGRVFNIMEAEAALILALDDIRPAVVQRAGNVLALLSTAASQQAIANAAIDEALPIDVRISLLNSLAESARHHANLLTGHQVSALLELGGSAGDDLAVAAARAIGALALPPSSLTDLVTR